MTAPQRAKWYRPDEVAECFNGVMDVPGLYRALWDSMAEMKPISEQIDIEESSPHDAIGLNNLASVWNKFSPEHQTALNAIMKRYENDQ